MAMSILMPPECDIALFMDETSMYCQLASDSLTLLLIPGVVRIRVFR